MKFFLVFKLTLFLTMSCAFAGDLAMPESHFYRISLIKLISSPTFYDSKRVSFSAYYAHGPEESFVYLSNEAFENLDTANSFPIVSEFDAELGKRLHGNFVHIIAKFNLTDPNNSPPGIIYGVESVINASNGDLMWEKEIRN